MDTNWVLVFAQVQHDVVSTKNQLRIRMGYFKQNAAGHWSNTGTTTSDYDEEVVWGGSVSITLGGNMDLYLCGHSAGNTIYYDDPDVINRYLSLEEIESYFWKETYIPNGGLTLLDEIENLSDDSDYSDKIVWSKQGKPDAFPATNVEKIDDSGNPIVGVKGFGNMLYACSENKIRPLLAKEPADLTTGAVGTYEMLKDVTREVAGLGVLAPDSLIVGELNGTPCLMFYSIRGIYAYDGRTFHHVSYGIDRLVETHTMAQRRNAQMIFHPKRQRLFLGLRNAEDYVFVGDTNPYSDSPRNAFLWKTWDSYYADLFAIKSQTLDKGELLWSSHNQVTVSEYYLVYEDELSGDYQDDHTESLTTTGITASITSPIHSVFDSELQRAWIDLSGSVDLTYYLDGSGTTIEDVTTTSKEIGFPPGSDAKEIYIKLEDDSANALELRRFDFEHFVHARRRL